MIIRLKFIGSPYYQLEYVCTIQRINVFGSILLLNRSLEKDAHCIFSNLKTHYANFRVILNPKNETFSC